MLVKAVGMTALWPAFAYRSTLAWNTGANSTDGMSEEISFESREYEARREFEAALNTVETLVRGTALTDYGREVTIIIRSLLINLDQHFHLMMALPQTLLATASTPKVVELCRLAGRTGDDLEIAASCHQRSSTARTHARCLKSGKELVGALTHLIDKIADDGFAAFPEPAMKRDASQSLLSLCCTTLELLSQLNDLLSVKKVAVIMDAECVRLRRLENFEERGHEAHAEHHATPARHSTFASVVRRGNA
ncbi:MAG: hypothetical protein WKF84_07950 [Pyrinomonadaceae bacterium]